MPINTENPIQIIRGDKASISARTGKDGEPNWATDTHELYIHDGVTPGGHRVGGGQEVDGVTIAKSESDVLSVIPGGIIDNDTIVLDSSGKISTKSIPFDKPSDNRWHQSHFIFSAVANTAVPVNATNLVSYDTSANNNVLFEPNSSGQLICRKTGLYGVRVEFSTYYVGDGSTEAMDGWFYIKLNNIDIGSSGTPILAVANEPNVFTCYVNRRIEAGQIISTAWNIPYTGNVNVNYIDYQFTYFPVTNEYQVSNAEYRSMYQTAHVAYLPAAGSPYPGENFFDIDWTQGGLVNETPNLLEVVGNTTFSMNGSGLALFNFGLSFSVADDSDSIDLIVECIRLSASGTETVLKVSTMAIRKERLNDDVFNLTVLAPIAEDDRVRLRVRTADTINVNLGCKASVSCTILPSITNTVELQPFEAATATSDGKAGLVPAPGASSYPENVILTAGLFQEVDLAFMHGSAESVELNKTKLGLGGVSGEGVNIDTLTRGGIFTANAFAGTLPEGVTGGVLLNIMSLGGDLYYGQQLLISYVNYRLYFRGNISGIQPGGTVDWYPWACLTPIPQATAGVGQWQGVSVTATSYTLPIKGVWAYYLSGLVSGQGVITEQFIGAKAGGAVISATQPQTTALSGLVWRVA